ncbi:MAG TPA: SDR family oxidoreductase [Polyangiaceae bacterium]|nr:SDR family oxidoreductase [Polyangiaceae bacterium]
MIIDLTGKTALVSGSTAGIGFSIAKGLALAGARVIVNGRTPERVDAAVESLHRDIPAALLQKFAGDLSDARAAAALFREQPDVDILVNNLGIFEPKPYFEIPDEDWERFFRVNVLSGVRLARLYAPAMTRRKWGRIVFISSESGLQIPAEMIHYGVTKTAQLAVSRGLAETLAGSGVTVNCVLPGPTRSEGVETFVRALAGERGATEAEVEKAFFENDRPTSLIRRFATTEEVANMVVYVCSEQASATTGSALRVDGGVIRAIA